MIRDEDIRPAGHQTIESVDVDRDAGREQDQTGPHARAPMREIPAPIEHTRGERERAEHDRVDGDGGNEKEDRPPPEIGRKRDYPPLISPPPPRRAESAAALGSLQRRALRRPDWLSTVR